MSEPDVTPEFLAECERLAAAATPGPWLRNEIRVCGYPSRAKEDAEFAAHARTAMPALVAEVRRLEACLEDPDLAERAMISAANCRRVAASLRAEAAESRAADLERQLAHEQTLRREAEGRVAELEHLIWEVTNSGGVFEMFTRGMRDRLAQVNSGQNDKSARVAEAAEKAQADWDKQEPEEAEPPRCLAWMCQQDAEPGEEVCARHGGEAPLRASVEAAERKRGGR